MLNRVREDIERVEREKESRKQRERAYEREGRNDEREMCTRIHWFVLHRQYNYRRNCFEMS